MRNTINGSCALLQFMLQVQAMALHFGGADCEPCHRLPFICLVWKRRQASLVAGKELTKKLKYS